MLQADSPLPQTFGGYALERPLARTDLSEVFIARNAQGQRVCLKRIAPDRAQDRTSATLSFRREAKLLAGVDHPNVVRVLDMGEHAEIPFLCFELIEGESLEKRLASGALDVDLVLDILSRVADGLDHVHGRGLVHGDLKPGNLLVSADAVPVVKIVDFGLAIDSTRRPDGLHGTPHYMAPEQTRLVDWPIDARTDLYALGVIAFELLTGRLPFESQDPAAMLAAHVSSQPPRVSELRRDVPPILDRIVAKLLEKNPGNRYRTARGLARDLSQVRERLAAGGANPELVLDTAGSLGERIGQVFIGRTEEMQLLDRARERATNGQPGALFVSGVAGVGKSALLQEFRNRSLTSGARFASGKCLEFARTVPYYVLSEALTHHLRQLEHAPERVRKNTFSRIRAAMREFSGELVKIAPAYREVLGDVPESNFLGGGRDRIRFLQMFAPLLEALSPTREPLVLLLDDLQWADSASLEVLESVVNTMASCSVLILATFRSEEVGADHALRRILRDGAQRGLGELSLAPLDRSQTKELIAEGLLQPMAAIPDPVVDLVYDRTEGNPLFACEVLKALIHSQALEVEGGQLSAAPERLESVELPTTVVETILRRLEDLGSVSRKALGAMALLGRGFSLQMLCDVCELDPETGYEILLQGLEYKVLRPPRHGTYRFYHDRVQEACAELVAPAARRALHRRVVAYLEAQGEELLGDDVVFELAEHATAAGDAARGWKYCARAGTRARVRYATQQALQFLSRALLHADDLTDVDAGQLSAVTEEYAGMLQLVGRGAEAIRVYEGLIADEQSVAGRARLLSKLAECHQRAGDHMRARNTLLRALELLGVRLGATDSRLSRGWAEVVAFLRRKAPLGGGRASERDELVFEILGRLWIIYFVADAPKTRGVAYRMMSVATQIGPSRQLSEAHRQLCLTLALLPRPPWETCIWHGRKSVDIALQHDAHHEAGLAMLYMSDIFCWAARYREALPWLESAWETLNAQGDLWNLGNVHIFSYLAHKGCGELDGALSHARKVLAIGERLSSPNLIANGQQKVAEILFQRGEDAEASSHLQSSLALAKKNELKLELFQALKVAGTARQQRRDYKGAREAFEAAIRLDRDSEGSIFQGYISDAYLGYAESALLDSDFMASAGGVAGDEGKRIRRYITRALARERHLVSHLALAHRARALWNWRRGKLRAARRDFRQAIAVLRRQDRPIDLALTWLMGAQLLLDTDPDLALRWARLARSEIHSRSMLHLRAPCDELLTVLGAPPQASDGQNEAAAAHALEELIGLSQLLLRSRNPDELLEHIVDSTLSLLGAERGFVFVRSDPGASLEYQMGKSCDGVTITREQANISRSVVDEVDSSGVAVAVSDTRDDQTMRERRSVMAYQLRSVLCAPLQESGERMGVLYIDSQVTKTIFGEQELKILETFAAHAAVALRNARQFSVIEELNRNLDSRVLERTRELESAYRQIERSMEELKNTKLRLAEARQDALEKELAVARGIQMAMVPGRTLHTPSGCQVVGLLEPASECGGDVWTFTELSDGRLLLVIGDVTGHGAGAAMITTIAKSCIDTMRRECERDLTVKSLLTALDHIIDESAHGGMPMTAFAAMIDPASKTIEYSSAGHNPQFLLHRGDEPRCETLSCVGRRLGESVGAVPYGVKQASYAPGDRLVLYTDGLIETPNPRGRMYGARRLRKAILEHRERAPAECLDALYSGARSYYAGVQPEDDITLVIADLA